MKVLIIGGGGREHALAWACNRSPVHPKITCTPGNGGTDAVAKNVDIRAEDINELEEFVRSEKFDLTIIGPEVPAVLGLADRLLSRGYRVFGPSAAAAKIEGSKAFSKALMIDAGIPTAAFEVFSERDKADDFIRHHGAPLVVKASGLAAGKGAVVCHTVKDALAATKMMMESSELGEVGGEVVIEDFLSGEEVSMTAIVDGTDFLLLPPSRDHKRIFDNDQGPNTGGMGAIAPLDDLTNQRYSVFAADLLPRLLKALADRGSPFRGVIYPGLMVNDDSYQVLEVNARFGDPETQVLLPLCGFDLLELMGETAEGGMGNWRRRQALDPLDWRSSIHSRYAATVVAASAGYPGSYRKGLPISGLPQESDDLIVFQAGTKRVNNELLTSGGRVLSVTGLGGSLEEAVRRAYEGVEHIRFEGMQYRHDIGKIGTR